MEKIKVAKQSKPKKNNSFSKNQSSPSYFWDGKKQIFLFVAGSGSAGILEKQLDSDSAKTKGLSLGHSLSTSEKSQGWLDDTKGLLGLSD